MKPIKQPDCETCTTRKDSLFSELKDPEVAHLSGSKTCNLYKKGQIIFYEGNKPLGLYCVSKGKIKVYKMGKMGKEQIVRLAKAGDLLGYRSLLGEETYTATAEALEDSVICFVDKRNFGHLLDHDENLPTRIMQYLCRELRDSENYIKSMAQKSVRERLAEVLVILKKKYGMDPVDNSILGVALTREDLANIAGTAIETAIRILSDMKDEGILSFEGRKIRILNYNRLIEVADLDY